jgi:AhpD family alkylhydroperoxidase
MEGTVRHLGYLPAAVARMATSPHTLDGFLRMSAMFEATTLEPAARETLILTVAVRNGCHLCVAMHTAALTRLDADPDLIAALRAGAPLPDDRLEALRRFTHAVLDTAGDVSDGDFQAFLDQGYTPENALEVVLGIGTYMLSTFANRMTRAPLDPQLADFSPTR